MARREAAVRRLLVAVFVVLLFATPCLANRTETIYNGGKETYYPPVPGPIYDGGRDILYDNGPLESPPGSGLSTLDTTLGMSTYGFGHQTSVGYWIADDFVIPDGETWEINDITFFAYQTGSPTNPSTITGVYLEIYDGPPNAGGTSIWGDASTNRLASSVWTGLYRVTDYDPTGTSRPIMANTCTIGVTLTAGDYWLVWQSAGSLSSGPWAPPITIPGMTTTGNGLQYTTAWAAAVDVGPQGFPFIIEGNHPTPVEQSTWAGIKAMFQ
jgi:hypothetical protein